MNQPYKFQGGDLVKVGRGGRYARVDDYDEEDDTYRVSYNETEFGWIHAEDVRPRGD